MLAVRTVVLFLVVLVVMRWTGKRTVTALAPFDLALVIMIGEVASIPIAETQVDLLHGLLPVVLLGGLHILLTRANLRYRRLEDLTEGKGTLLVFRGRALGRNLERERVSMQDLRAALRLKGVTDVSQVEAAWMEHSGGVSVVLNPEERPVTRRDLEQLRRELVQLHPPGPALPPMDPALPGLGPPESHHGGQPGQQGQEGQSERANH